MAHFPMLRTRLAVWLTYLSLLGFALQLGGSLYEHLVVDTAWLENPALIQPARGGLDRKLFWIPVHTASTVLLLGALWAGWSDRKARRYVLWALGLYLVVRLWTLAYFVPLALGFEAPRDLSADMLEQARQWVTLSLLRLPFVLGSGVALWLAGRRCDRSVAESRFHPSEQPWTGAPAQHSKG
jgi:hypothetical protein